MVTEPHKLDGTFGTLTFTRTPPTTFSLEKNCSVWRERKIHDGTEHKHGKIYGEKSFLWLFFPWGWKISSHRCTFGQWQNLVLIQFINEYLAHLKRGTLWKVERTLIKRIFHESWCSRTLLRINVKCYQFIVVSFQLLNQRQREKRVVIRNYVCGDLSHREAREKLRWEFILFSVQLKNIS